MDDFGILTPNFVFLASFFTNPGQYIMINAHYVSLNDSIEWEKVWNAVHNVLSTNKTKSLIWQQIHLHFYT